MFIENMFMFTGTDNASFPFFIPLQFGTHDVVALKPNKADAGSASLGQGVVYRLKVHPCHLMLLAI
jgi:hypothetical protein